MLKTSFLKIELKPGLMRNGEFSISCFLFFDFYSSVQSLSRVQLFVTPWTAARQASLSITNSRSLLKLMSTESMMPSNYLILCCPLLLLPSIFYKNLYKWILWVYFQRLGKPSSQHPPNPPFSPQVWPSSITLGSHNTMRTIQSFINARWLLVIKTALH